MGYYIEQTDGSFTIRSANKEQALTLLNKYGNEESGKGFASKNFELCEANNLKDAFRAFGYMVEEDGEGGIEALKFEQKKLHDDYEIFKAVAPAVEDGSFIEIRGEDNVLWRWVFNNGECTDVTPEIIWDKKENNNTILQFIYESDDEEDKPAIWPQVLIIVNSEKDIDYAEIEDSLSSYLESDCYESQGLREIVQDVMDASGLDWIFVEGVIPESKTFHTFWI